MSGSIFSVQSAGGVMHRSEHCSSTQVLDDHLIILASSCGHLRVLNKSQRSNADLCRPRMIGNREAAYSAILLFLFVSILSSRTGLSQATRSPLSGFNLDPLHRLQIEASCLLRRASCTSGSEPGPACVLDQTPFFETASEHSVCRRRHVRCTTMVGKQDESG